MIRPYPFLKNKIKITSKKTISYKDPCFIVAEISANHSGSLKILKKSILVDLLLLKRNINHIHKILYFKKIFFSA